MPEPGWLGVPEDRCVALGREDRQGRFDDVLLLVGDRLVQGSVYRLLAEHGDAPEPRRLSASVMSCRARYRSPWGKFAVKVGAVTPPSMRKSLPVMNVPSGHHEQRADGPYLIWGAATPDQRQLDHAPVSLAAGSGHLVLRERGEDNAGADRARNRDHARKREPSSSSALWVRTPKHPRRSCRDRQHPTGIRTGAPARIRRSTAPTRWSRRCAGRWHSGASPYVDPETGIVDQLGKSVD